MLLMSKSKGKDVKLKLLMTTLPLFRYNKIKENNVGKKTFEYVRCHACVQRKGV